MKKTLSLILVLVFIIALAPMAFADNTITVTLAGPIVVSLNDAVSSLTAVTDPTGQTVVWSSSNESAVTVDDSGKLTLVAVGDSVITAKIKDSDPEVSQSVTVSVKAAKTFSLDKTTATMSLNQTINLVPTADPAPKSISWASSDEAKAIVADGAVTAKALGTATITATATYEDGTTKSASCAVTVEQAKSLVLSKTEITIGTGEKADLGVTVDPATGTTLTYGFSDTTVASATEKTGGAEISGLKAGETTLTVTAKYSDNTTKTATCKINVVTKVTGITLNKTSTSIENGKTETLVATVTPDNATDKTVIWTSSDESVATVSGGTVTGVKAGTAVITAKTKDGGFTATCSVTVTTVAVTGVTLNQSAITVSPSTPVTLVATVLPTNATNKAVTWTSSNSAVAEVDANGKVTGKAPGSATITVKTTEGNFEAKCVVTVPEVSCVVTMGKYYGSNLGKAYFSLDGKTWSEVTSTTGYSISVTNGTVVYFKMDPYSGYYRHPYVVNANGSYYAPYIANGTFSVTVNENKVIKLNFSSSVPTGDVSMWQYVVAAFASAGTATGIIVSTKRKK